MTVLVADDKVPLPEYTIEVSDDEPDEVKIAFTEIERQVQQGVRGRPSSNTLLNFARQARARAAKAAGLPTDNMRKALFAMANELHLSRDDRLELAEVMFEREITTWRDLSFDDARRLLDAMHGYTLIRHLRTRK